VPFESWPYLRFVLPSFPLLFVMMSVVLVAVLRQTAAPMILGAILFGLLAAHGVQFTIRAQIFDLPSGESRYRRVGEFVARHLPENAVLLSMQHSGSLRYYSRRVTIRYDFLPADRLDQVVTHLVDRGYRPHIVLDAWEEDEFRARFRARSGLGRLDWPPVALAPGAIPVAVYDAADRTATDARALHLIP
jgi:hypothetical protein